MKTYLVGGAVRDKLLGLPVTDRDWVVVGATIEDMIDSGYKPVGSDFPVFLHPVTHEEYALARTERKTFRGYAGFEFHTSPDVTLEEDLIRRDLTINAIAEDDNGLLIDPFDGQRDIDQKLIRHVSDAFMEDPVRVLRAARFAARFAPIGFTIAEETLTLMTHMVTNGEVDSLVAERVWNETERALRLPKANRYFESLRTCGALKSVLPEIDALFGVPQPAKWHPEIDTGIHVMLVLNQACKLSESTPMRFAALCHDVGKALTPAAKLPAHHGHEEAGVPLVQKMCQRLRAPKDFTDLARLVTRYHKHAHTINELKPTTITRLLESLDVVRKPDRFELFLLACEADARGRLGFEDTDYPQREMLRRLRDTFIAVDAATIAKATSNKADIPNRIHEARSKAIAQHLKTL